MLVLVLVLVLALVLVVLFLVLLRLLLLWLLLLQLCGWGRVATGAAAMQGNGWQPKSFFAESLRLQQLCL